MTRCFLGFELSEESRAYLRERLEPLHAVLREDLGWPVRLVPPENWHATLLFFQDLEAEERAEVWAEVARAAEAGVWQELAFAWHGLALWPKPQRPNLLCLEAAPYLAALQWPLTARLDEPPFSKGDGSKLRRYIPHITVMRFRQNRRGGRRLPWAEGWAHVDPALTAIEPDAIRLEAVSLFLSTANAEQPIYPREYTAPLG